MKHYQCFLLCLTSFFATYVSANSERRVRQGVLQRESLQEAISMCPEFINRARKAELKSRFNALLAPAYNAKDPNRKSYGANYIPSPEERSAMAIEMCGGHVTNPSAERQATATIESESPIEVSTFTEDDLNFRARGVGDFKETFRQGDYSFFFLGTVCGMLVVFVYFHATGLATKQNFPPKTLRRPEL